MSRPKVTVVVPAWDLGTVLDDALASARSQDEPAHLVVVDNASEVKVNVPDGTDLIRLPERVSIGAARNAGLAAVKTEYVLFLDGDDVLLTGAIGHLLAEITADSRTVAVAGGIIAWNPTTNVRVPARWPLRYAYVLQRLPRLFTLLNCARNLFPVVGPVVIRTAAARAAGGFADGSWAEDWAFGAALCFQGPVRMTKVPSGLYRIDENRNTLSDLKEGSWRKAWDGRSLVRAKLRKTRAVPRWARCAAGALIPVHFVFTFQDLRRGRQRI